MEKARKDLWFAVCCKPRQESVAEENLLRQDFQVYLPRMKSRQRKRGRWVDVVEALFPRYVFIRIDPSRRSTASVRSTRGVVGLVRFGRQPAVVPDAVMEMLLKRADSASGFHEGGRPGLSAGDPIRLVDGPLVGMEGVFAQQDGESRVAVLMELLGKANRVFVSRDWVVPA